MWIIWTIVIGFVAGVLAKFLNPRRYTRTSGLHPHNTLGYRRSLRNDLPWSGSRLVSRRPGHRVFWRDSGRSPNFVGVGLHRIQENPLIRGRSCRVHSSSSGSTSHRLNALFGVVLDAVDGAVDRVGHHRSGIVRLEHRFKVVSSRFPLRRSRVGW